MAQGLPQEYYGEVWDAAMAAVGKVTDQVEQLIDLNYNMELNRCVCGRGGGGGMVMEILVIYVPGWSCVCVCVILQ